MDDDTLLIARSLEGDRKALEALLERNRTFIYNVALKFFNNIEEAQDATQEVLLKTLSRLSTYDESKAAFRTWLYRITFHHFLNAKQTAYERNITGFGVFHDLIDSVPSQELEEHEEKALALDIQESMVSCTAGMIMCLDREQRLVYIVGEVFEIGHLMASEALDISPDNFRQKLSRARRDLQEWMNNRCGLVNQANPCRCPKKTKGFIAKGWEAGQQEMAFRRVHQDPGGSGLPDGGRAGGPRPALPRHLQGASLQAARHGSQRAARRHPGGSGLRWTLRRSMTERPAADGFPPRPRKHRYPTVGRRPPYAKVPGGDRSPFGLNARSPPPGTPPRIGAIPCRWCPSGR
ncbi:MAG: sigma-70 family RNA polymerase sigma factor [Fibrobacteres bacterium]|nr:sigma-70 family RNA polymerase sigma factor [Fibrobacterota bacterium]